MEIAGYRVHAPVLSSFRLDGGAMFGSVPRPLWERFEPPDEKNRIGLVARCLWLEGHGRRILVDAGTGDKFGPREAEIFAVEAHEAPFRWEELTDLLLTHLHFDHAGGATWRPPGAEAPAVRAPGARILLQRRNWERATAPGPRERASYLPENVEPLRSARLELLDGPCEPLPGVRVRISDGHTAGMQWLTIGEGSGAIAFPADLVPTSSHIHLPFVMGYDLCVETLLREKEAFLEEAAREGWTVVFEHDRTVPAARIGRKDGRFVLAEKIGCL
jgi:glyoxylase-like metal-dependent hydrolase (beta-lactamase superfamily II)